MLQPARERDIDIQKRWEIETAFRAMKSSGFNIEDTHMRDMDRIARLVAMVCMALVWAYLVGEHKDINIYCCPVKKDKIIYSLQI